MRKALTLQDRLAKQEGGFCGIATADTGRYIGFQIAWDHVKVPPGTAYRRLPGLSVAANYNRACRLMLEQNRPWVWLMDDDHFFGEDLLINLLERDVDVVTPLYLMRSFPFDPVLHRDESRGWGRYSFEYLQGKEGLLDVTADATIPTGGMLIRRHVLEAIEDPWFETGQIDSEWGSWDIYFSEKVRKAGFKLHLDLDNTMGHITPLCLWPVRDEDGNWRYDIRQAHD